MSVPTSMKIGSHSMSTIAFIGLGAMGARMAHNLLAAGHHLKVYNRSPDKLAPLLEQGATACPSPAQAVANSDFAIVMVADDEATRQVMLGENGLIQAAKAGTILIDCGTVTPATVREISSAAKAKGLSHLDAPVQGSLAQAQNKELIFLVGGDQAAFDRAQPLFAAMGQLARYVGASGAGSTIKLINNMLSGTVGAVLVEAARMVQAAGIDAATAVQILSDGAAGSRLVKTKLPKMLKRDFSPQFQLELMEKDLRYFLGLAEELQQSAPLAMLALSQYQAASQSGQGKLDFSAVYSDRPKK